MSGFTKLVPEIIQSSIWNEPPEIRCVWITMLAIKDENGYVQGDDRTISRLSNVTIESTRQALELFQRPDPGSKTPDNDGKRIAPAPGGWLVLNHENYRLHDDIQRDKSRERVRRFREKHNQLDNGNVTITLPSASVSASVSDLKGDCKGGHPNPQQVQEYAQSIGFRIDGQQFVDYYEARGWKYKGGVSMKNWQAAVRTWKRQGDAAPVKKPLYPAEALKLLEELRSQRKINYNRHEVNGVIPPEKPKAQALHSELCKKIVELEQSLRTT